MDEQSNWWRKSIRYVKESIGMLVLGAVAVGTPTLLAVLAVMMIQGGAS